jgi:hypothetical protein
LKKESPVKIRDATQIIGMLERGDLAADLSAQLAEVIDACREAAGPKATAKGSLTLKLDVEVEGVSITLSGDIVTKLPKLKRGSTFMFLTADGALSTEHPNQASLFGDLKEVRS